MTETPNLPPESSAGRPEDQEAFVREAFERMRQASVGLPIRRRFDWAGTRQPRQADEAEPASTGWRPGPGIARSKNGTGPSRFDPQPLGSVIGRLAARPEWQVPLSLGDVAAHWEEIVGPQVAQHCEIESFADGKLQVRTDSTAWAQQLRLLLPTIERRVAEELGEQAVRQVVVHGPRPPSWHHGQFRVPGRGPRDTYG